LAGTLETGNLSDMQSFSKDLHLQSIEVGPGAAAVLDRPADVAHAGLEYPVAPAVSQAALPLYIPVHVV
jgi:hypothetical protein